MEYIYYRCIIKQIPHMASNMKCVGPFDTFEMCNEIEMNRYERKICVKLSNLNFDTTKKRSHKEQENPASHVIP